MIKLQLAHRSLQNSVTLEEIDNAEDFVASLEKIEPPGQMVSFLADPLLQKFVDLRPSPIAAGRIDLWLAAYLEEEYTTVKSGLKASSDLTKFLENIYKHSQFTKVCNIEFDRDSWLTKLGYTSRSLGLPQKLPSGMGWPNRH